MVKLYYHEIRKNTVNKGKEKSQLPIVIQSKLQNLSKRKIEILERLFLEAKWLYNWLIADINRINLINKRNKRRRDKSKRKH